MVWHERSGCPEHHVDAVERAANAMPPLWRTAPVSGEHFESIVECERRVRGFAFVERFELVRDGRGNASTPGCRFSCIFHDDVTRNVRGLEPHVKRNKEGEIVSNRKREATNVRQSGCKYLLAVSFKSIGKRNSGRKGFVLDVKHDEYYEHELFDDPLMFTRHLQEDG